MMRQPDDVLSPTQDGEHERAGNYDTFSWWRRWIPSAKGRKKPPMKADLQHPGGSGDVELKHQRGKKDADSATISIDCRVAQTSSGGISPPIQRKTMTEDDIHRDFSSPEEKRSPLRRLWGKARRFSILGCVKSVVPLQEVLRTYKWNYLLPDMFAGISEGVMAIPQGMSYAMLARLPPQMGLYVNFVYPLVYMLFGTGRHVAVGVSAIEDLLLGESVTRIIGERERLEDIALARALAVDPKTSAEARAVLEATADLNSSLLHDNRIAISVGMSVCVGLVFLLMRVLQAGLLADLLAVPVLSGFSTASAFLIGTSQLKHALGLNIPATVEDADFKLLRQWWYCATHIKEANWVSVCICVASLIVLAICKMLNRKYFKCVPLPGPLLVVIIFTALSAGLGLEASAGIKVIGNIPKGFPSPAAPRFSTSFAVITEGGDPLVVHRNVCLMMLREALALTAMFFVIHISIAKTITQQKKTYSIRPDQELVALSACNFVGSCFQCFPNATSLSRTCVVASTGGLTQLHQISNALVLVFTLSFMTPLLYALPNAVLAAVVLFGVYGMLDFRECVRLAKIGGLDVLLWLVCFLITIIFGAMEGILASILLSLLWLLRKTARPSCAILGKLPKTFIYRNIKRFPMAVEEEGIRILRFDASLNFSNSDFFESRVLQSLLPSTRVMIVDGSSINDLDVTAIRMLERLVKTLGERGVLLLFANWKGPMRDFLQKAAFYDVLPPEHCFLSIPDAVFWANRRMALGDTSKEALDGAAPQTWSPPGSQHAGALTPVGGCLTPKGPPPAFVLRPVDLHPLGADRRKGGGGRKAFKPRALPFFGTNVACLKGAQTSQSEVMLDLQEKKRSHAAFRRRSTRSQSLTSLQEMEAETADGIGMLGGHHQSILWDGLSARSVDGLRVVTEITGSGQAVRWAVCATAQEDAGEDKHQQEQQALQDAQQDTRRELQQERPQDVILTPTNPSDQLQPTQKPRSEAGGLNPKP
ncbi:sulfate transporter, putative [Eimeria mitis]|uniref:Sulfate transporter, putative n=1 Tax=Eimeria mitis TaxID=44415 RepID=U6JTV4_9EIME|nr:sulfate transporter, putative [Eimeria mitis]CDJ28221.1 sulfate transporter, putative [Eimeria mitis]